MAAKEIKTKLKAAKGAIAEKQHERALDLCQEILELDSENYHALVFAGKCSFELGNRSVSKEYYTRATNVSNADPLAWKGLVDFYDKSELFTLLDKTSAVEVYEQYLQFIKSDADKLRVYKKKLASLYKQVDKLDKAVEVLSELTADSNCDLEFILPCWEMLVDILLYKRNLSLEELQQVTRGLRRLEVSNPNISRRRNYLKVCRDVFYKTNTAKEAEIILEDVILDLPHVVEALPEPDALACVETMVEMCVCKGVCSYPPTLTGPLRTACEKMSGLNISNMKVALCRGLLDVSDVGKLKEAFEMVSSEEHSSLLSRVVRGILCVRMHSYQQARRELEQCVKGISSLPVCWEKEYGISFNMLLAECSVGLEEWSDALETLSEVCTHVDKVFVRQHINPLKIQAYLGQGDLGHAEKMIAKLPQDQVPTMTMKAEVMLKTKDIPSAVEVLQGALELDPKSFDTHYLHGVGCWEWSEGARRKDAYKHFVKAASLDPYHSNTYYHLGLYFESLVKDQAKAVQCYRKAVERSPGNEAAAKALAGLLAEKKDEEELLALYKHVTSSCSLEKSKWAWMRMGLLQKSKTQYTTALTSLFNVVKANPKDSECWECIAETYFSRGSYTSALKSFNKALEINPESLYCKTWIAKTKAILGDTAEACKDYTAVLSKDPSYLLALKGLGETHYKIAREKLKENFDGQAVDHIQQSLLFLVKAARLKPGFSSIWKALGDACICLVDVDLDSSPWKLTVPSELTGNSSKVVTKAELLEITSKLYVQVCHIQPNSSYVWHDMAVCLYHRARLSVEGGKREEFCGAAIESMKKATNLTPNDAHHWCTLGVMATMMGSSHYAMAQDAFIRSLNISEQDPTAWTNLGILYLKADNVKLAHECFRRALSADPAHQPAWVCEARVAEIIGETAEAVDMYRHATELEYSDESCRQYAQLVCDTLNSLPHQSVVRQDGAGLNAVAMRSVLQARTSMDKYIKRHPDDVVVLNLFGLLCEHEGLLEQATTAFQRALACVKMANHGDLKAFVESNLARVLVERNDPDLCKKAAKLYSNQIDSKDHVTLAYKALAHYCAKQYEEADKDFSLAVESCPSEVKSLFLATRAMASFELNPSFGKELLFQAFQTPPPSVFSLVGLISFGVVSNDFTLAMAAVEELIKMKDWSKEALHPNCIDNLLYIRICLLDSPEGASCLQRINDFWSVLKENDFYSDLLVKKESLMSVLEHQRSGNLDEAKLSAAKYYHNFPSHVELIPFILDTLQLSCV